MRWNEVCQGDVTVPRAVALEEEEKQFSKDPVDSPFSLESHPPVMSPAQPTHDLVSDCKTLETRCHDHMSQL